MNSIITLKQYEKLTGETMEQEKSSFIETLIRVASDMIESYIGYDLEKQDRTEIIQKKINISRLWIKYPPINSVKNISINKKNIGQDDDAQKYSSYKINDIAYSYKENETFTKHIVPILKRLLW